MPKCKNDPARTYRGTEPSPKGLGFCAHASQVGSKKKGNNGEMWIVKKIANGSKRWVKLKAKTSKKSNKKPVKKSKQKTKKYYNIIFCEPSTYSGPGLFVSDKIKVSSDFYKVLKKKPRRKTCQWGNAYIFGKTFKKDDYKRIGSHGNDVAQTGFVDMDLWSDEDSEKMNKALKDRYDWDDRKTVTDVQKAVPAVLWFGTTDGGDVGADLYAHYNNKKQIDGFIVENNCIYPQE